MEDRRAMAPMLGGISLTSLALYLLFSYITEGQITIPFEQLQNVQINTLTNEEKLQFEGNDSYEEFASTVLGSNDDMWEQVFSNEGIIYDPPTLVLFRTATETGCGTATSEVGPFYCPLDQTIYLDETFFEELTNRFGARGGDVAQAYVISHEVGHHVQNLLGILDNKSNSHSEENQSASIQIELQADCFAGLWAYSIKELEVLSPGEIIEAMDAAAAVGDDRIQKAITGRVNPETWTHGSSEQRVNSFTNGYESGELKSCGI